MDSRDSSKTVRDIDLELKRQRQEQIEWKRIETVIFQAQRELKGEPIRARKSLF
jgi:hypothetical protein